MRQHTEKEDGLNVHSKHETKGHEVAPRDFLGNRRVFWVDSDAQLNRLLLPADRGQMINLTFFSNVEIKSALKQGNSR